MKQLSYCWKCGTELEETVEEGRERLYCPECEEIVYRNSVPVAGVFVVKDDKVLMIKRGGEPNKGKWSYPAGYLEYDEIPEKGASRELEEETGLKVNQEDLDLVSTIHLEHPYKYVVGNAYTAPYSKTRGEVKAGTDAQEARFWTVEEMKDSLKHMESEKIVEAAEKAIEKVKRH